MQMEMLREIFAGDRAADKDLAVVTKEFGRNTWFSQSYFTQKGIWRRDRGLLQNCPIIFPALPPVQRHGRRGGIGPGAIQHYWRRFELGVMELRARDRLDPFDSD